MVDSKTSTFKKYFSLVLLIVQTSSLVLVMRYSRTVETRKRYLSSTAVVCAEIIKLLICLLLVWYKTDFKIRNLINELKREITGDVNVNFKILFLSLLYTIQTNLLFVALSNLDAATYQVTYQFKILTTALFSVLILGKKLDSLKWLSLLMLMAGIILVQWRQSSSSDSKENNFLKSQVIGLMSVLIACFTSGFASAYFEKILKNSSCSIWIRNIQLSFFGTIISLLCVVLSDYSMVKENGFFQGYNYIVWVVVLLQAFGGLIIGAVMKHADNILICFASSLSIILSSMVSYYFLKDFIPNYLFVFGTTFVVAATFLYAHKEKIKETSKDVNYTPVKTRIEHDTI